VQNPVCFNNDSGVTVRDRAAHEAWARTKTRTQVRDNLLWKTGAATRCLDRPNLVAFFADMSAVLARVPERSGGGAGSSSGGGTTNGSFSANVGRWSWSATCSGSVYTGTFTIANVNPDGTFGGAFQQNGTASYDGTIAGRFQSGRVSFTRRWSGPDQQQWDGTLDQTRMAGTIAGFGAPCTFTANKQ
jgi:hypothetical protein